MAHVSVTIAGRVYRMACADGEEAHLEELARQVDDRIAELRAGFGEIGDQRLTVMSAVTFADALHEAKGRIARQEAEIAQLREAAEATRAEAERRLDAVARAIENAAARIEAASGETGAGV